MCRPRAVSSPSGPVAPSSSSTSSALSTAEMSGGSIARARNVCDRTIRTSVSYAHTEFRNTGLDIVVHYFERQRDAFQRNALNLRDWERAHPLLLPARVELVAHPRLRASCPATALLGSSARHPLFCEFCQPRFSVVVRLFDFAAVDHIDDVVDGDRGLANCQTRRRNTARYNSLQRHSLTR